jgi:LuxR family transcriptional regulator, maltose regulon positive regulatory protein
MAEPPATTPAAAATAERDVLLATKLHIPRSRPDFVARPRLADRLAPTQGGEVTLVCAPAGFGKTALLADWARRDRRPVAWLSLDDADNDPARFWRHTTAALERVHPVDADRVAALLGGLQPTSFEAVVTALVNELAGVTEEVVLVLDDYHLVQAPAVHASLGFLIDHLPPQLRLVLSSRADPPLPLARLRARGQLAELRERDLRFTSKEATELLLAAVGAELPEAAVALLQERTEGWVAGLQLAALSLQGHGNPTGFVTSFSGSHRYVLDYLAEEVLDRQPEQLREFLLETSVLERLSGPLCDAVTGRADSQQLLEHIERVNLFLVPLDEVRRWWRYHHLFADLLRVHLAQEQPEQVPKLHQAAAAWCEQHGLVDEAVRHALASGDALWATRLVEQHLGETLRRGESVTLQRWLSVLPEEGVRSRPALCLAQGLMELHLGHLDSVERLLEHAERALEVSAERQGLEAPTDGGMVAEGPAAIALLRSELASARGDPERTTEFARSALAQMAEEEHGPRLWARWLQLLADWMSGRMEKAASGFAKILTEARTTADPHPLTTSCHTLGWVQQDRGKLDAALQTYREGLRFATRGGRFLPFHAGEAHLGIAQVLYARNQLDEALRHVTEAIELTGQVVEFRLPAFGMVSLAWIRQAMGDAAGALEAIDEACLLLPATAVVTMFSPAHTERAGLLLAQGRVAEAEHWTEERRLGAEDDISYPQERDYLVLARVLLARHDPERALGLLERLHALAAAQGRTGSVIEVRALQALARSASGDQAGALAALAEALTLGAPEGYLRVFLDEGPPMAALLHQLLVGRRQQRLAAAGAPREYLARMVDAFERVGLPIRPPVGRDGVVVVAGLVEPLTARELEVLQLLAAGAPNRAIAEQLVVTQETVKKHLSHLFDKLGVANRTQAVARARELGLLP